MGTLNLYIQDRRYLRAFKSSPQNALSQFCAFLSPKWDSFREKHTPQSVGLSQKVRECPHIEWLISMVGNFVG